MIWFSPRGLYADGSAQNERTELQVVILLPTSRLFLIFRRTRENFV